MLKTRFIPKNMTTLEYKNQIQEKPKILFRQNSKLKKDNIYQFSLPAYKSIIFKDNQEQELKTCPNAGKCVAYCYASSGNYISKNVILTHSRNLNFVINFPEEFVNLAIKEISEKKISILRIHDSGDFFSEDYLNLWFRIIEANPNVKFYAYTKQVSMFKLKILPKNFTVVFSFGGKEDNLIDEKKDRFSKVFKNESVLNKLSFQNVSSSDLKASQKRFRKIGLIAHGNFVIKRKLKNANEVVS